MRFYLPRGLLKRAQVDLSDLTESRRVGDCHWDPAEVDVLVCPMDPEPTVAEQVAIRRRLVTADEVEEARLYDLIATRAKASGAFQKLWLDTELARYGETD